MPQRLKHDADGFDASGLGQAVEAAEAPPASHMPCVQEGFQIRPGLGLAPEVVPPGGPQPSDASDATSERRRGGDSAGSNSAGSDSPGIDTAAGDSAGSDSSGNPAGSRCTSELHKVNY